MLKILIRLRWMMRMMKMKSMKMMIKTVIYQAKHQNPSQQIHSKKSKCFCLLFSWYLWYFSDRIPLPAPRASHSVQGSDQCKTRASRSFLSTIINQPATLAKHNKSFIKQRLGSAKRNRKNDLINTLAALKFHLEVSYFFD